MNSIREYFNKLRALPDKAAVYQILRSIVTYYITNFEAEKLNEEALDLAFILLVKIFRDSSVLPLLTDIMFRRYREGRYYYDLVWALYENRQPADLVLIASRLVSVYPRDVELSRRLLHYIPGIAGGMNSNGMAWMTGLSAGMDSDGIVGIGSGDVAGLTGGAGSDNMAGITCGTGNAGMSGLTGMEQYEAFWRWFRQNNQFQYTGECFQQTGKPIPYMPCGTKSIRLGTPGSSNHHAINHHGINHHTLYSSRQPDTYAEFEKKLRANIKRAAIRLNRSGMAFTTFRESRCNKRFWERTDEGGFKLKADAKPSDAIADIFSRGRLYGTECATAIVIVFFGGILETIPQELFDRLYGGLYLMNWVHIDEDIGIYTERDPENYLPGDCRYFKNPDVDPLTPEWQGENVIVLEDDLYYGHGIGITTGNNIIKALNMHRIEGSETSAYLTNTVTRPDYRLLYTAMQQYHQTI